MSSYFTKSLMFSHRVAALAVAAGLSVVCVGASAAGPVRSSAAAGVMGQAGKVASGSSLAVLYDQNNNDVGIAYTSQNFEASSDSFDNQGADDFVVPAGVAWGVQEVIVTGMYFNGFGPAPTVRVTFYRNARGKPGEVKADFPAIVPVDNGTGSFALKLPKRVGLKPGKYWVSVQANMDYLVGGQWGWQGRSVQSNQPAQWQNPPDGFGTGCTSYAPMRTCLNGVAPDFMFSLNGQARSL